MALWDCRGFLVERGKLLGGGVVKAGWMERWVLDGALRVGRGGLVGL